MIRFGKYLVPGGVKKIGQRCPFSRGDALTSGSNILLRQGYNSQFCPKRVWGVGSKQLAVGSRGGNRIKDDSRKGAKGAKFGEVGKYFSLRSLRPFGFAQDRLGAKNFVG